jgi:hypothetical protein
MTLGLISIWVCIWVLIWYGLKFGFVFGFGFGQSDLDLFRTLHLHLDFAMILRLGLDLGMG